MIFVFVAAVFFAITGYGTYSKDKALGRARVSSWSVEARPIHRQYLWMEFTFFIAYASAVIGGWQLLVAPHL